VGPKEVYKTQKGVNGLDIGGGVFGIFDGLEFVVTWFDTLWS